MSDKPHRMTSNRPYLIRAMYEWIGDNGMTPYLLVDASHPGVQVPPQAVQEGRVVLNIAPRAVAQLELGNQEIRFMARFSGVSQPVLVPVAAVHAIYAQETGQGMMLPAEEGGATALEPGPEDGPPEDGGGAPRRGHLRVVK
ncbi:ClpXP protease specificity-enhancing factor [Rehaibacterium terrae]|jgi:stringent starvation protein B|uniref:Stringent starvation protein B n=1 Tax=Rehaibacterium terrae TaxID=1341696 RepID=A0A7W7XZ92_9GAMM|nr:ClpXP protease specificity-enhancing factor [Rehaibacterium terrae]MBB5015171.1 stringent starvation protein B [Rehaibacterium terrae]